MAARKKKAVARKKAAARSSSSARPARSRRSNNAHGHVDASAGVPPAGALNAAALEREVTRLTRKYNKRSTDEVNYPKKVILADAHEMQDGTADLAEFRTAQTPITQRHFDWLNLLVAAVEATEDDAVDRGMSAEQVDEDLHVVMNAVVDARRPLAARAAASGIPLSGFSLEDAYSDPAALHAAAARAARMAERRIGEFVGSTAARRDLAEFQKHIAELGELLSQRRGVTQANREGTQRKAVLLRMLFDCLTFVGSWGRVIAAGDPTLLTRYGLDNIFPSTPAPKQPAPPPPG